MKNILLISMLILSAFGNPLNNAVYVAEPKKTKSSLSKFFLESLICT